MSKDTNTELMKECLQDAQRILSDLGLNPESEAAANIAVTLFQRRAGIVAHVPR